MDHQYAFFISIVLCPCPFPSQPHAVVLLLNGDKYQLYVACFKAGHVARCD